MTRPFLCRLLCAVVAIAGQLSDRAVAESSAAARPNIVLLMSDVAADPRNAAVLGSLRGAYDAELAALREHVIPAHDYPGYKILFDRAIPWSEKVLQLPPMPPASGRSNELR